MSGMNVETVFTDRSASVMRKIALATDETLRELSDETVIVARDLVPVLTGHLKASIRKIGAGNRKVKVITSTGYGAYVELGTRKMAAQPYVAPAFQQAVHTVLEGKPLPPSFVRTSSKWSTTRKTSAKKARES